MTQAVTGSGYSALCLHIKATVFPKMLFSCQQDDPIPPGWLWALAAWHPVGCILLAPGSAAAQGTPGLLSVVLSCCWRLSRTDFLLFAPCTLLVLSWKQLWILIEGSWSPASTNPRGLMQAAAEMTEAGPVRSQLPTHLLLMLHKNTSHFA